MSRTKRAIRLWVDFYLKLRPEAYDPRSEAINGYDDNGHSPLYESPRGWKEDVNSCRKFRKRQYHKYRRRMYVKSIRQAIYEEGK